MIWDEHTYLMCDWDLVEKEENTSMVRAEAVKYAGNPLVAEENRDLFLGQKGYRIWVSCVTRQDGLYRMWYWFQPQSAKRIAAHNGKMADYGGLRFYAESKDGIEWRPGKVGTVKVNGKSVPNAVDLRVPSDPTARASDIMHDPLDKEFPFKCCYVRAADAGTIYAPARTRWPYAYAPGSRQRHIWGVGRSRDGLHWEPPRQAQSMFSNCMESPKMHRAMDGGLVIADQGGKMAEWSGRGVWGVLSYDEETSELIPDHLYQTPQHQSFLHRHYTGPGWEGYPWIQPHVGLQCARKGPTMIALHGYLYGAIATETYAQVADVGLAVSPTGLDFRDVWPFRPFIRRGPQGAWDSGLFCQGPIVDHGDETRFYCISSDEGNAAGTHYWMGMAHIGRDRYGYRVLRVYRDYQERKARCGTVTLKSCKLPDKPSFAVNVSHVTGKRTVRLALLDAKGRTIPGFSFAKCTPVTRSGVRRNVTWTDADMMKLAGRTVSIRAELISPDCQYGDQDSPRLYAVYTNGS